jgi:nucleoside-diphosphate-sugar epimerase
MLPSKQKILITGATGFVGSAFVNNHIKGSENIKCVVRHASHNISSEIETIISPNFSETNWGKYLQDVDVVVHMAAQPDIVEKPSAESLKALYMINIDVTLSLVKHSIRAGVKRFIFISSIKAEGVKIFKENHLISMGFLLENDFYGASKYGAEQGLLKLARKSEMEVVIIRPPLVYGPGVKANFASLIRLVKKGIPLPLGAINNKRSLIAIDNLVDFISLCADRERSPQAANQVFVVSDDEDVSTTELLRRIAKAYDKKQWLIPIPVGLMKFVAKLLGKSDQADRVFGNLQVDCAKAKDLLGWKPVITMDEQLKKMADAER